MKKTEIICFETTEPGIANELYASGEWRMPLFSIKKECYILIKKAKKETK